MAQGLEDHGLEPEALLGGLVDDDRLEELDGDRSAGGEVGGLEDLPHPSLSDEETEPVAVVEHTPALCSGTTFGDQDLAVLGTDPARLLESAATGETASHEVGRIL